MITAGRFELPPSLVPDMRKARKWEWLTVAYLTSTIVLMYLTMGSSQAMKTAWLEDALSVMPAILFLISSRIYHKAPTHQFPYGFHRVFSITYLAGSLALLGMGLFLILDATRTLIAAEHPGIGSISLPGIGTAWMGWIMMLALLYSAIPAVLIGRKKLPLAQKLHNKLLFTDAEAQKADYLTAGAAILGISLVGFGWWWADAVAAMAISLSVIRDGFSNVRTSINDLMDRVPVDVSHQHEDKLLVAILQEVLSWPWVADARIRFREHGQVYFGEVKVIPSTEEHLIANIEDGMLRLKRLHWKVRDVVITVAEHL